MDNIIKFPINNETHKSVSDKIVPEFNNKIPFHLDKGNIYAKQIYIPRATYRAS